MKTTNPQLIDTIRLLRKASRENNSGIWAALADEFEHSKHARHAVNLSRISRTSEKGETVAVPGKVIGSGSLIDRTVAAFTFSQTAMAKIEKSGGECMSLIKLIEKNPKGSGVRI
ncbi:50S ribosomal protein L18e, partial [Candidatus Bathyarchaeota archaeon]|nr:50S ribosomal protein L18e [Candidatus Bathyarchaeota archaeon]